MKIKIAPSILSADFSRLQDEINKVSNADWIHLDVMDGHFVPNLTFGPVVIKNIKTNLWKDAHLMITDPEKFAEDFVKAGVKSITFHAEAVKDVRKAASYIKGLGVKVGVSINPDKDLSFIEPCLDIVDLVLIMSVFPGFAGQKFIPDVLEKVSRLREMRPDLDIEIDGGMNDRTVERAVKAGANVIVAGSYVFNSNNPGEAVENLRRLAEKAAGIR